MHKSDLLQQVRRKESRKICLSLRGQRHCSHAVPNLDCTDPGYSNRDCKASEGSCCEPHCPCAKLYPALPSKNRSGWKSVIVNFSAILFRSWIAGPCPSAALWVMSRSSNRARK